MRKLIIVAGLLAALARGGMAGAAMPQSGSNGASLNASSNSTAQRALTIASTWAMPNNVKVMTVADPPMGQEYSGLGAIVVPAGVTWRLVGFTYNITFDVTKPGTGNVSLI